LDAVEDRGFPQIKWWWSKHICMIAYVIAITSCLVYSVM